MKELAPKITLVPFERIDELCPAAEPLLIGAMRDNGKGLIVVNNLLMKLRGRLVGVSLTEQGPMEAGHWYTPSDTFTRDTIRSAFDNGERDFTLPGDEEWIDFHPLRATHDDQHRYLQVPKLFEQVEQMAEVVRTTRGLPTKERRVKYRQQHEDLS